jgi:hypothetical protein
VAAGACRAKIRIPIESPATTWPKYHLPGSIRGQIEHRNREIDDLRGQPEIRLGGIAFHPLFEPYRNFERLTDRNDGRSRA